MSVAPSQHLFTTATCFTCAMHLPLNYSHMAKLNIKVWIHLQHLVASNRQGEHPQWLLGARSLSRMIFIGVEKKMNIRMNPDEGPDHMQFYVL